MRVTSDSVLFFSEKDFLSNWYPSSFTYRELTFKTLEHFLMCQKAALFNDKDAFQRAIAAKTPKEAKKEGRSVRHYNDEQWKRVRGHVGCLGAILKFTQNETLLAALWATEKRTLVEASPWDKIWGIGLSENDDRALKKECWQGGNLLGDVLEWTRDELLGAYHVGEEALNIGGRSVLIDHKALEAAYKLSKMIKPGQKPE